jgi:hypothetical protein
MTEDVLEQVVDDWLRRSGYFTRTNVRFGPVAGDKGYLSRAHNQRSDLDVVAVKPTEAAPARVLVVSCKAMQAGFSPNRWLAAAQADRVYTGKPARKHLRELWDPMWAAALRWRVDELTRSDESTCVLAVTRVGPGGSTDVNCRLQHPIVSENLAGNPCEVLTFSRMWSELRQDVKEQIEPSHVGRLAQLLKAAELDGAID